MGRDNHNAGMHFVHHTSRVSEADAVAYIQRKDHEKEQAKTREKYADLMKHDNPCHLKKKDMTERVHVNFYNEEDKSDSSMYRYRVKNANNKKYEFLTLWVGYDIGGEDYVTGEIVPRGYYFYFTNKFDRDVTSRKLLLFEVNRKSKADLKRALEIATVFGKEIVINYYRGLEIEWEKPVFKKFDHVFSWINAPRIRCFRSIKNCTLEM